MDSVTETKSATGVVVGRFNSNTDLAKVDFISNVSSDLTFVCVSNVSSNCVHEKMYQVTCSGGGRPLTEMAKVGSSRAFAAAGGAPTTCVPSSPSARLLLLTKTMVIGQWSMVESLLLLLLQVRSPSTSPSAGFDFDQDNGNLIGG